VRGFCHLILFFTLLAAACTCAARADEPNAANQRLYVIVFTPQLREAADECAAYRAAPEGGSWTIVQHEVAGLDLPPAPQNAAAGNDPNAPSIKRLYPHRLTPEQTAWEESTRNAVRNFIRATVDSHVAAGGSIDDCAVLLLGDAPHQADSPITDPLAPEGEQALAVWTGIPTFHFDQPEKSLWLNTGSEVVDQFASDQPYQVIDKEAGDLVALGRIPARTNVEARIALEKVKRYEAGDPQAGANAAEPMLPRITFVSGEGHFGPVDGLLERMFSAMVDRTVPEGVDVHMTYAKATSPYCPPPSRLTETVLDRLDDPSLLFNYIGHGSAWGFDSLHWGEKRLRMLRVQDLARLPDGQWSHTPLALLTCCSTGWFDLPSDQECLAEGMLFTPAAPVAIIAGSRPTHPYANAVLQRRVLEAVLDPANTTVGEAARAAELAVTGPRDEIDQDIDELAAPIAVAMRWDSTLPVLRTMHTRLYNLLGDPALVLRPAASPVVPIADLRLEGHRVAGAIPGMVKGTARITIETARDAFAQPEQMVPVIHAYDRKLERKAAINYPLANDRVLHELEVEVNADGRFIADLPADFLTHDEVEPNPAAVRVAVVGVSADGRTMRAAGGLRLSGQPAAGSTNH